MLLTAIVANLAGLILVLSNLAIADLEDGVAFFPPWWPPARAFEAAGSAGQISRAGALPTIIIVHSTEPGLSARLKNAGAFLVLNPIVLALCSNLDARSLSPNRYSARNDPK